MVETFKISKGSNQAFLPIKISFWRKKHPAFFFSFFEKVKGRGWENLLLREYGKKKMNLRNFFV